MLRQFSGQYYLRNDETIVVVHWDKHTGKHYGHPVNQLGVMFNWNENGDCIQSSHLSPITTIPKNLEEFDIVRKVNPQNPVVINDNVLLACEECQHGSS